MAHYAKVNKGIVLNVIVAEESFFDTFIDNSPGNWVQTSYNTRGGIHYGSDGTPDGGNALRKNHASIGGVYDKVRDAFIPPQPYPSWVLNEDTCIYEAPVPYPTDDDKMYTWDEDITNWVAAVE